MRDSGALQVVVALSLVVITLGPFVAGPLVQGTVGEAPAGTTGPVPKPDFLEPDPMLGSPAEDRSTNPIDREVRVIANLSDRAAVSPTIERQYETVYTREGARQLRGTVELSEVRSLSNQPGVGAVRIEGLRPVDDGPSSPGVGAIGADELHSRGITGEGVTVGVIDSGYRLDHPRMAGHVSAYRSFGSAEASPHGTAVASVVADTAPRSDLHLAAIGPRTSPAEYRRAVNWLKASGADVIVDAGSYFQQPGHQGREIEQIAANSSDDVVFVTSAGNYAQRHWRGSPANDSERVSFAPGVQKNHLNEGEALSGRVTVSLNWRGDADYDLYLLREFPMGDVVVDRSTTAQAGSDGGHERISTTVPRGRYYVTVVANSSSAGASRMDLFASHRLSHGTPNGSLTAPATSDEVIAVGAYSDGTVESFSSRGPTADGSPGVDVVAPDAVLVQGTETAGGTSFAAPYVAGVAALLKGSNPDLSPEQIEAVVLESASDVGPPGRDPTAGYGVVNATAAYELGAGGPYPALAKYGDDPDDVNVSEATLDDDRSASDGPASDGSADETASSGPRDLLVAWGGVAREDRSAT